VLDDNTTDLEIREHLDGIDAANGRAAGGLHQRAHLLDERPKLAGHGAACGHGCGAFVFLLHRNPPP
jgi:hypothetical protein